MTIPEQTTKGGSTMIERELSEIRPWEPTKPMSRKKSNAVVERLWLTYFNDSLYAQGVITETERNKMRTNIKRRAAEMER